jgi:hypothetical protein
MYTTQLDTTKLSNGPHTLSATACDKAGNCTTTQETVYVNNTIPKPNSTGSGWIALTVSALIVIGIIIVFIKLMINK